MQVSNTQQKPHSENQAASWWWAVLVFVVFVLLRLFYLDNNSLWYDELHTAVATAPELSWNTLLERWLLPDVHPPLFYGLVFIWQKLGMNSDFLLRLLPLLFSFAFLPVVICLQKPLLSKTSFAVYLALLLAAPFVIYYGAELRSYAMLYCWAVLATAFFHRLLIELQQRNSVPFCLSIGLAMSCGLAALTHYFSFYLISAIYLVLCWLIAKHSTGKNPLLVNMFRLLVPAVLAAIPAIIWFVFHLTSLADRAGGNFWISNSPLKFLIDSVLQLAGGLLGAVVMFVGLSVAVISQRARLSEPVAVTVITGLVIAVLVSLHTPMITPRNLLVFAPLICLWLAQGFPAKTQPLQYKLGVSLLALLFLQSAILLFSNYKQDWRAASQYITEINQPDCPIPYEHKFDPYMKIATKELYAYYFSESQRKLMVKGPEYTQGCQLVYMAGQSNWRDIEKQLAELNIDYQMKDFNYVRVYTASN